MNAGPTLDRLRRQRDAAAAAAVLLLAGSAGLSFAPFLRGHRARVEADRQLLRLQRQVAEEQEAVVGLQRELIDAQARLRRAREGRP